jgi:hypothetical protein
MASIKLTNESVEARVEVLQGQENYLAWKRDLKFIAEANNVWNILTGEETIQNKPTRPTFPGVPTQAKPAKKSNGKDAEPIGSSVEAQASDQLSLIIQFYKLDLDEYEKQQKRLRYARGLLSTTINTALRGCIKDEENPQLAMEKLKGLCKMNDARALDMTLGKIEQLKFKGSVSDLINTLKTLQQDIIDLEGTFSDEQLMSKVVRSLPNRFNRFLDTWNLLAGTAALPRDLVTLHGHLLGVEAQLASEKDNKESDAKNKGRERKDRQLCEGCNKWGTHNESECWIAHPELRENKLNKQEDASKQFKGQVNTVKNTGSKDHPKPQSRHGPKHPGRIVATAILHRSKWEATCANAGSSDKIMNLDKYFSMKDETNVSEYNNPGDSLYPGRLRLMDGLNPQTMMLLKDDAVERSSKWIVDSGANVCIANDKAWFSEFQKITYTVGTANNGSLHIEGAGTVLLQLTTDGNEPVELELHNVAYAQDARCNILSLSWIAEKAKLTGVWGIKGISIRTAEGFEVGHASLIDGLFHLQIDPPEHPNDLQPSQGEPILLQANSTRDAEAVGEDSTRTPDQQLPPGVQPPFVVSLLDYDDPVWKWHRRMGHLSVQSLRDLLKVSNGIDLTDKQLQAKLGTICPVCATTRAVNRIPRDPATRRATNPGEMMHADAWGPYPISAWDSTVYILAITDDATRFTWSARYATKDKIPEVFRHLHRTIEKRNNITIRAYRLDNEFPLYGELRDWFQRHAISVENSVPYTHHMNGVAERGFRTNRERASAMLQEATNSVSSTISKILGTRTEEAMRNVSLSETLWVEAFSHAIWIKNRSPSRALEGKITPWEAFYKLKPNLGIERIFGSRVYVTYPPEHRQKTLLQPRGWIGYFVGFETEAVLRVWHPDKKRVVRITAPRVDDGQGQTDDHDGETLSNRIPISDITLDDDASDNESTLETPLQPHASSPGSFPNSTQTGPQVPRYSTRSVSKTSPYFPQIDHNTVRHPEEDSDDQVHPYSDSLSETQSQFSSTPSDNEPDNNQEEAREMGSIHKAFAEAGIDYDTWDDAYAVYDSRNRIVPQANMLTRQGTRLSGGSTHVRHVKPSASLPPRKRERRPQGQLPQDKCERCRKNGYVCKRSDPTSRCDHCNIYGLICSFAPDDDRRKGQPPQDKCDQCRQVKAVCRRSNPNSRCDKCQSVSRVCSFVPEDNKVPRWSDTYLPPEKKCYACTKERRRCYPTEDPNTCRNCPMRGYKCSFGGNIPRGTQDPKDKCKQCRKSKRWCEGGSAEARCIPCQKRKFRCSMLAPLNDPECVACQGSRRWGSARRCQAIPCLHCRTSGRTSCSFRVNPNTAVYHPIQQNLHPNSMWHRIQDLGIQHECCARCAELGQDIDAVFYPDNEFPCNICTARQDLLGMKEGATCLQFNDDDGGYKRFFFRGIPRGPPSQRLRSPPPMTEAGTPMGEDDEDWETLDESLDEDLEIEDGEILIDPALLEPQANLAIASCPKKGNHSLSTLRLHKQVYDLQPAPARSQQELQSEINRSSSSTTSMFSSPVSLRETADKGKITMEEASRPTICMMSVSANSLGPEPHNRKTALASTEWNQWEQAMQEEYNSLLENKTWEVVDRPINRKVLTGRWVFKRKLGPNGEVARHKARFVVRGFSQIYGLDFDETYASVVKSASYRILFALQARYGWKCHQMDIKTAFLNGDLKHEIFVEPPEGYPEASNRVLKLCKSLYGLKQAPRQWYFKLRAFLEENGWRVSNFDPSVFIQDDRNLIMEVYVDDINIFGINEDRIIAMKEQLASRFNMTDLGLCAYYLGMHVHQKLNGDVHLHQESYIQQILERYGLQGIHPRKTPMRTNLKLTKNNGHPQPLEFQRRYQSKVGALNYAMVVTRPDIAEAVGVVSRFCANPTEEHMKAVDDIYAYLKYTPDLGLHFKKDCPDRELHAYVDADWAGCPDTRRSTTGYVVKLAGSPVSWSSRRQRTVAMSTCEAEYVAGYKATQEIIWIQNMINDLRIKALEATSTPLLIDNNAALKLTRNPELHDRTKHIELKYHFLREMTLSGRINTQRVSTKDNLADLLTKPLPRDAHENLVNGLGMDKSSCTELATCR